MSRFDDESPIGFLHPARVFTRCTVIAALIVAVPCSLPSQSYVRQWAWMGGNNAPDLKGNYGWAGNYGVRGQFSPDNRPGARTSGATWIDKLGHLWLFGGFGFDAVGNQGALNDLWEFDPSRGALGEWAWIGGSGTVPTKCSLGTGYCGRLGLFGTEGQFTPRNIPSGRSDSAAWVDGSGNFWLFGGGGYDSAGTAGPLDDLWEFDPARGEHGEWAWMGGSSTIPTTCAPGNCGQPGVYGALGKFASANIPGARSNPGVWTDHDGNLWLFGGAGEDSSGNAGWLNDLWKFEPRRGARGEWAWLGGSANVGNQSRGSDGIYGQVGQFSTTNVPGGRFEMTTWTDASGHLWLFGGSGLDSRGHDGDLNDLWEFDPSLGAYGAWAWISGQSTEGPNGGRPGVYGTLGKFAAGNTPGCRYAPVGWFKGGELWLYGGTGCDSTNSGSGALNDLWEFDPGIGDHGEWAWEGGSSTLPTTCKFCGVPAVFGRLGHFGATNVPGGRNNAMSWTDRHGNFWLFGGQGYYSSTACPEALNDFWESKLLETQAIQFHNVPSSVIYGVKPITLWAAGGGSGNPVVFSVESGPGKVSERNGSLLTVTGTGTIVVAANQAGSSEYAAAPQATHNILVTPAASAATHKSEGRRD
jgi:hypothetical protein